MRRPILHTVLTSELRYVTARPQFLLIVPIVLAVVPGSLLPYIADAILPAAAATLFVLAPLFTDLFGRSAEELSTFQLFPSAWEEILLAKNIAAATVTLILGALSTLTVWTFGLEPPGADAIARACLYWMTLIFPLLSAGNFWSVLERRGPRDTLDSVADRCVFLVLGAVLSIPYGVFVHAASLSLLCVPFTALSAAAWWWSIVRAARLLRERIADDPEVSWLP
jgi:hypothetical protein